MTPRVLYMLCSRTGTLLQMKKGWDSLIFGEAWDTISKQNLSLPSASSCPLYSRETQNPAE